MQQQGNRTVIGILLIAIGVLMAVAPRYGPFAICEHAGHGGMMQMACHWVDITMLGIGIVVGIIGLVTIINGNPGGTIALAGALGLAGIATIAPFFVWGICKSPSMPCNNGIMPMMIVTGVILGLISLTMGFSAFKQKNDNSQISRAGTA